MQGVMPFTCPHCRAQSNVHIKGQRPHLISCTGKCKKLLVVEPVVKIGDGHFSCNLLIKPVGVEGVLCGA